jgi:endonuclease/exonuclease/phosphatase family metal-dependent hydrolase
MRERIIRNACSRGHAWLRLLLCACIRPLGVRCAWVLISWSALVAGIPAGAEELISIATFNVENYLLESVQGRRVKAPASRRAVRDALFEMKADLVFLQELGSRQALLNIQTNLLAQGLHYSQAIFSETPGSPIHLGMLSRLPVGSVRHHTTNVFVLYGRAFRSSRAFLEVDIRLSDRDPLKVFAAHLKSKRPVPYADQWDLRTREALMLRQLVENRMKSQPGQLVAVVGDFNDDPSSETLKHLRGPAGKWRLADARPMGGRPGNVIPYLEGSGQRRSVWTHFFDDDDVFSRMDYILMNRDLSGRYRADLSYVLDLPTWGVASDHRPVLATFELR